MGNRWVGGGPYYPVQLQGDTARSGGKPEAALSNRPMASQPPLPGLHSALQEGTVEPQAFALKLEASKPLA